MIQRELHVHAACIQKSSNGCDLLTADDAIRLINERKQTIWLNLYGDDDQAARLLLQDRLGHHELAVEDALSDLERPTLQEFDDVLFFVVPVIILGADGEEFEELAFFLTEHSLVTYCRKKLDLVSLWFERWKQKPLYVGAEPVKLAHTLLDAVIDAYFPFADMVEEEVDQIADLLFAGDVKQVNRIQSLKRRLLLVRRQLSPTRDVLNSMLRRGLPVLPDSIGPYFQDVLDHVLRLSEMIDMNRETLASLLDVHLSTVANNTNEVMKRMTFYATALMTSTLVAGIYGMNFDHMPELHWTFGYPLALAMMLGGFLGVRLLFKRRGWI